MTAKEYTLSLIPDGLEVKDIDDDTVYQLMEAYALHKVSEYLAK